MPDPVSLPDEDEEYASATLHERWKTPEAPADAAAPADEAPPADPVAPDAAAPEGAKDDAAPAEAPAPDPIAIITEKMGVTPEQLLAIVDRKSVV